MNSKWLLSAVFAFVLLVSTWALALAQEPPPPYAGLENPFPWDDADAQSAGKALYERSCISCHGATGAGIPAFDFSKASYAEQLEDRPDVAFWELSEGRLTQGMPPFKASLSEEQRWQVLTYMWSLGAAPTPPGPTPSPTPPLDEGALTLVVPPEAQTGEGVTFLATLTDNQGKPRSGASVKFLLEEDFFARGLVEIGEATTNAQGMAALDYTPRRPGEPQVVAWFGQLQTQSRITITDSGEVFYHTEAGVKLPSLGPEIFIGPDSAHELGEMGNAPTTALRLPGGALSWLWLFALVLIVVYGAYIVTMYEVLRISTGKGAAPKENASLVPRLAILALLGLGVLVVVMVITGPYSHFHLSP